MSFSGIMARKGASVTFSKIVPGTYDPETEIRTPPTTLTVTGKAMQVDGDPDLYARLQLIESENPTLEFKADVIGVIPVLGMTVPWGNETLTVKNIKPLAMNGTPTAAFLVCSRG
jgi:hypothetical protein